MELEIRSVDFCGEDCFELFGRGQMEQCSQRDTYLSALAASVLRFAWRAPSVFDLT